MTPKYQNEQGVLIADFADIGMPHVEGGFAVELQHDALASEGMRAGDIILFDPGEPQLNSVVAIERDGALDIRICQPEDVPLVAGVAVGLIRRL